MDATGLDDGQQALLALLRRLDADGYDFVTINNDTHARVMRRDPDARARDLRGLLGWSLPAEPGAIDREAVDLLRAAGALEEKDGLLKSRVRVSRVAGRLYLHSAWPTGKDSVFLGPDSYRFARFLTTELEGGPAPSRIVDIGAGAGVGGLTARGLTPGAALDLTDVNPQALRLAAVNAAAAGAPVRLVLGSGIDKVEPGFDLAVANPPFMAGEGRTYSAGGDLHGAQLSLDWAEAVMAALAPGGRLLMYTASAILDGGHDRLKARLEDLARDAGALAYREIDPDIFGSALSTEAYRDVERIAAVGIVLTKG